MHSNEPDDVQFPDAATVGLHPPPGMVASTRFAGFEDAAAGASIRIAELPPDALAQVEKGFAPDALAVDGMTAGEREPLAVDGSHAAFMLRATQSAHGTELDTWLALVATPTVTAVITVQRRRGDATYTDAAIDAALRSVRVRAPDPLETQIAALPFRVRDRAGFRALRVVLGSGLMLTEGPKDVIRGAEQPLIVVAHGLAKTAIADDEHAGLAREVFARRALETMHDPTGIRFIECQGFRRHDSDWVTIEAHGRDRSTRDALHVVQTIRFLPTTWIRVVALLPSPPPDDLRERVRQLSRSVEPRG